MSTEKNRSHSVVNPNTNIDEASKKLFQANPELKESLNRASNKVRQVAEVVANNLKKK